MPGNRPSRSAIKMARVLVYLAQDPQIASLLPPRAADSTERLLIQARLLRPRHVRWFRKPWIRRYMDFVERQALRPVPSNLHLLGVDLSAAGLDEALAAVGAWRRDAVSVVVAEGVLMYLEEAAVARFLATVRGLTAIGSRLLFTYIRRDATGRLQLGKRGTLMRVTLRLIGEPLHWGVGDELMAVAETVA